MPETINDCMVSMSGLGTLMMMNPPRPMEIISKDKALRLAAWLVAMADDDNSFDEILKAVKNT